VVAPDELRVAVERLAAAVKLEIGDDALPQPNLQVDEIRSDVEVVELTADERKRRCLSAMLRMRMIDHQDGSSRLFAAACRAVEHDLTDADSLSVLRQYALERPFSKQRTDDDILKRIRDAERVCERGAALRHQCDEDGRIQLGTADPRTGRIVLSPRRTLPTADAFVREFHRHVDGRTIHSYAGMLLGWNSSCFAEIEDEAVRNRLHYWLHEALRYIRNGSDMILVPFDANPQTVKAALETIKSFVHLPAALAPPAWLDARRDKPASELLPCRSCLLHLPTMECVPSTPALFVTNALNFDPDLAAPDPAAWLKFLDQLFPDDNESQDLLQEWFGYVLTPDTSQQKMLLICGPRRSGKGTIARVLTHLVGPNNVCGPTTSSLAGNFGLQPLVGKTLAIVSDARFRDANIGTVVERLLCISGEDAISIDRKYLASVTMKLNTRLMFLSNEIPQLNDASGALAGRFLVIRLTESFFGREDKRLGKKMLAELPGILNWAIAGWKRLNLRGHFVMPQSASELVRALEDLASPIRMFVRERCVVDANCRVALGDIYREWERWCDIEGHRPGTRQAFGRDLLAAEPSVVNRRNHATGRFYEGIGLGLRVARECA
jgi:putative DNA primase/helicase